jgi:hypothetical protein
MSFELWKSLIVSMWAHSSWPWACSQPLSVPAVVFSFFFFFPTEFWAIKELDCEPVSSQLVTLGLHTATTGTGSGFFYVNFLFQLYFELSMSLIVSMWAHSSWPWACSQPLPVPAVVFSLLNFIFSTEFWAMKELDCDHVSSQLMALGLLTANAGTGIGFMLV